MPVSVTMPALGESVTEGTITRWLKKEGERVETDEPLLEVSTDKVDTEIPSPVAGVVQRILVGEDETIAVGTELAVIGDGNEAAAPAGGGQPAEAEQPAPAAAEPQEPQAPQAETQAPQADTPAAPPDPQPAAQPDPTAQPTPVDQPTPVATAGDQAGAPQDGARTDVVMPALGESVTEGTVTRWLKNIGDTVQTDEPLLEVSTDKVDTEIPSPASGTLLEIRAAEDQTVEVGATLAVIGAGESGATAAAPSAPAPTTTAAPAAPQQAPAAADQTPQTPAPAPPTQAPQAPAAQPPAAHTEQAPPPPAQAPAPAAPAQAGAPAPTGDGHGGDTSTYVTPLVRKLATEHGVDLTNLSGTGVGGRIRKQDVLAAAERARTAPAQPPASAPAAPAANVRGNTEKMSRLRKLLATRMVESLQTAAQLTTVVEIDVTRIARLRDRVKRDFEAREGVKLSFLPFFALAAVEALKVHPKVNSSVDMEAGTVTYHDAEHLGIAVDTERGLLAPVIHNAGDLNLAGFARKIADLADRTRNNKITPDELSGGTFTLTNTGSRGALFDTPILFLPQVAMLGTGAVVKRPVVVDDADLGEIVTVRSMVYFALSYDHRIVDGADAARFLTAVKERLEAGAFEADLGL